MRVMVRIKNALAILTGALFLAWPALYNHYPLLYPDSISYLSDGGPIALALLHRLSGISAMRSEIYSLGIFFFHWKLTPWPIVALQALLTSYVLWLVIRSILPRHTIRYFLGLVAFLSLLTSISWYVSLIMPDILGALLYLCIYLLIFARETLTRAERWSLALIAWWAVTAHSTHLILSAGLCFLLALLLLFRWKPIAGRGRALAEVAAIVFLGAGALVAIHAFLYGKPSLNGNRPPYLMARVVADGPGAWYLRAHCATLDWAICADVNHLPDNDDDFLWGDGIVWAGATPQTQQRLLAEEMPLVKAALRAYPRAQFDRSWANFTQQLNDFGVNDFDNNDWMANALDPTIPGSHARYMLSLQSRSIVPTNRFTILQRWIVLPSAVLLAALIPWLILRRHQQLLGLIVVIPTLIANAFVTAVLSSSDSRYQSRVVWLIPLVAALAVLDLFTQSRETSFWRSQNDRIARVTNL